VRKQVWVGIREVDSDLEEKMRNIWMSCGRISVCALVEPTRFLSVHMVEPTSFLSVHLVELMMRLLHVQNVRKFNVL